MTRYKTIEEDIKETCIIRNWCYNVVSAFLIETKSTPYRLAKVMGVSRSVVHFWLHHQELSGAVQFQFMVYRKIFVLRGINILDLF